MTATDRQLRLWLETVKHARDCYRAGLGEIALIEFGFLECLIASEIACREVEREHPGPCVGAAARDVH